MERNAYFDNAKVVLIFLVVFGHMIQPFTGDSPKLNTLYIWIYTFHMPAFIFLSGFFAKGSGNLTYIWKLVKKLLIPYLIFQIIYSLYYLYLGSDDWFSGIFYPHWSLWFLFSLFSWHIMLHYFKKMPPLWSIILAILVGFIAGYFDEIGHTFSLSRTFAFFPFFLAGHFVTTGGVMKLKHWPLKLLAVSAMIIIAIAIYETPDINTGWLLASESYGDLGMPALGGITRLFIYLVSTIMVMSVLAWIPTKKLSITKLGARTLYVYLLHGFFIQLFREINLFHINSFLDLFMIGTIAASIVLVLSSKPILGMWQPLIEGKMSIIKGLFHRLNAKYQS